MEPVCMGNEGGVSAQRMRACMHAHAVGCMCTCEVGGARTTGKVLHPSQGISTPLTLSRIHTALKHELQVGSHHSGRSQQHCMQVTRARRRTEGEMPVSAAAKRQQQEQQKV